MLRVAMIAPPWLNVPPRGYGGIEPVVYDLVRELTKLDVTVELFGIATTRIRGVKVHSLYDAEQYHNIHRPMYEALPIPIAHVQFALDIISSAGNFDIIHDHNGFVGPLALQYATQLEHMPPAIHTMHGPAFSNQQTLDQGLPDNRHFWAQLDSSQRLYIVGISKFLTSDAPARLRPRLLPAVYNALDTSQFQFRAIKQPYFMTLARFAREKGQHIAAGLCDELGFQLRMAGTVAGIGTLRQLALEMANPLSKYRYADDFRYYSDEIMPYTVNNRRIVNVGNISGSRKLSLIAGARALLFPIDWEEPFGMAVIEAMASGTPVIAMNRGAMPEIIEHGVNGFLANSVEEFRDYMKQVDKLDPATCRRSVEAKFASTLMAKDYLERYREVLRRDTAVKSE